MYVCHLTELTINALHGVAQVVEALSFKMKGRGFDSR